MASEKFVQKTQENSDELFEFISTYLGSISESETIAQVATVSVVLVTLALGSFCFKRRFGKGFSSRFTASASRLSNN